MRPVVGRLAVALALAGCGVEADYTLTLTPRVPGNQSPFQGGPEAHLRLRDAAGNVEWMPLGAFDAGTREENGLGPLAGHTLGLALGPNDPEASLADLVAWGESAPVTLGTGKVERTVDVLVAQLGGVGTLDDVDTVSIGAAAAALPDGRVYLFGGVGAGGGTCSAAIRKLPTLQAASWSFERVRDELPGGVCYAVATVVDVDGAPMIVVSGGEAALNANAQRSRAVAIFDPATDEIVWSGAGSIARARHGARAFPDGRVLLVGASQTGSSAPTEATFEVSDAAARSFGTFGGTGLAPWDFMSAPLPGALAICGGATWSGVTVTPTTACAAIGPDGTSSPLPALPIPLRAAAMTALADGSLLVAGGITTVAEAGSPAPAIDRAFSLPAGASAWQEIDGPGTARAYAHLSPDATGGAVLLGGVATGWGFGGPITEPSTCGERYVPGVGWSPLEPCANAGTGMLPSAATSPGGLLFALEGRHDGNQGGSSFGVVGLGP